MLLEEVKKQIMDAMKAKDSVRLATLKLLSAELTKAEIEKKRVRLTEEEELAVVRREAKKRRDAIEIYRRGGAGDKAEREGEELVILEEFLPQQMSDEDLEKIVEEVIIEVGASGIGDIGKVMGPIMGKVAGRADGGRVSALVREKLS